MTSTDSLLTSSDLGSVIQSILATALRMTRAEMGAIAFVEGGAISTLFVKTVPGKEESSPDATRILKTHFKDVILSAPHSLPLINHSWLTALLRTRGIAEPPWRGHLTPLVISGTPFGVLGIFSKKRVRDHSEDFEKLTPLIAMARRNAALAGELAVRAKESRERLEVLYHISDQLRADEGLQALFQNAVEMVSQRIGSEEAALFIADQPASYLRKVAVAGPDPATTAHLAKIELTQAPTSLTGSVFDHRGPLLENAMSPAEPHADDYSRVLPSGVARHYMGAPLMIGDEVMGVIRVINKTARNSPIGAAPALDVNGFTTDDLELLTAIATNIASAIRNATYGEKNRHFAHLVYTSPDPIIVIDGDGRIQNFNNESEKIWGVAEEEVLGKSVEIIYESREHAREIARALLQASDHTIRAYQTRIRSRTGEIIPMRLSANLLFNRDGERASSIGIFKDAREMIRNEESRLRAEKIEAIGRLAQTTGHDIKHDLGAILNFVIALDEVRRSDPWTNDLCSGIRTAAMDALQKIQNMLLIANRRAPEVERVSLRSLIDTFAHSVDYRAALAGISFETRCADDKFEILGDIEQLRQVWANLFGNSLDAISEALEKGRPASGIVVTITVDDRNARLVWSDDGVGVGEDVGTMLFAPFFTTKATGSGLGLYITKNIIERHGGRIRLLPSGGSGGMSLEILLPLHREL
jgi:PAS domain S-box-containing protein